MTVGGPDPGAASSGALDFGALDFGVLDFGVLDFRVLGPVEVRGGGRTWPVGSGRERFVLATLLLGGGQVVTADLLTAALWPQPPSSARSQLHNMISNLRRRLRAATGGSDLITTTARGYRLDPAGHTLDVTVFRELAAAGRRARDAGDHAGALSILTDALALWRGQALADVSDELAAGVRRTLHDERITVAEVRLDAALALGHHEDVVRDTDALLAEQPYREHLYRRQMLALAGLGRRGDALATYQQAYQRLVTDLGVEPGSALRDLQQRILRGESPVSPVVDKHRAVPATPPPRQLPPATAVLTGRDALLGELVDALRPGDGLAPPTVVLVGPGGIGKTTLALTAAHRLAGEFPGGNLYADLRGSHDTPADPHTVVGRLLRSLGVDGSQLPEDPDERVAMYRSHLAGRRMLVVLDDAAGEAQVRPLLPGTAHCGVLVTSRRQFAALVGAARFPVPVLTPADALALLTRMVGRRRVAAEPAAAAAIVALCGQLPLAVCIAAARLAVRTDSSLGAFRDGLASERRRLDELAVGDLDVRASIGLSYRSLSPAARMLLRRLSLVTGPDWPGWVVDALAGPGHAARALLAELTEVHLVEPLGGDAVGQARYQLHDLVADFGAERADAEEQPTGRAAAARRLVDGWLALATVADRQVGHGAPDPTAIGVAVAPPPAEAAPVAQAMPREWFEVERTGLVAAVDQACERDLPELAGSLALRLYGFLALRAYDDDRERVLTAAVACARRHGVDRLLAPLLRSLIGVYSQQDRHEQVTAVTAEALEVARRLGEPDGEALSLAQAGRVSRVMGRLAEAADRYRQSLAIHRDHDVPRRLSMPLAGLADVHLDAGEPDRAVELCEEALAVEATYGTSRSTALMLHTYASAAMEAGRLADAERAAAEALAITRQFRDDVGTAYVERLCGDLDITAGRLDQARERLTRSLEALERRGNREGTAAALGSLARLAVAEGHLPDAVAALRRALPIWRQVGTPLPAARTLAFLARVVAAAGDEAAAATYRTEYQAILTDLGLGEACLRLPPELASPPAGRPAPRSA